MLTQLRIRNFKSWQDTGKIRLAPITVLFGSNSAGKSSIIQFLLMLKQTIESPDRRRVLHPGDEHTPVDLGTFHDLVYRHDETQRISFEVEWVLPEPLEFTDPKSSQQYGGWDLRFEASVGEDLKKSQVYVENLEYTLGPLHDQPIKIGMAPAKPGTSSTYKLIPHGYPLVRNQGRVWQPPPPVRFYGFPDEVFSYYQNADFLASFTLSLEKQFRELQYLGPLRNRPKRAYTWAGEVPEHVGWSGERAVEALLAARDRKVSPGYRKTARKLPELVAAWLKQMDLLDSFEARTIAEHRKEYEVMVKTKGSAEEVNLTDVGFGISQVLPVVVSCFYAAPHSTILMEQPELHLHPAVQSEMADLFVEAIHSRQQGEDRGIQFIIESHSEHFLHRLQRRIAEEGLKKEEVALYFCETVLGGSALHPLEVDLFGNITNWPKDFFGDDMSDLVAMTEAAARRNGSGEE
jgi:predicted ATPase